MLGRRLFILLATALVACSTQSAPPPASSTSASALPSPAPDQDRCLASIAQRRIPGWTERGKIIVPLEDGQPISMQAADTTGAIVTTRPAPKSKADARAAMKELTCRLGGVVATLDGAEPSTTGPATASFVVLAPAVVSEQADLATLCTKPEEGAGEAQKRRLTFVELEQRLTSARWRAWLFDLAEQHEQTSGSDRMMLHWRRADELADAARRAGLRGTCWFESQLRSPDG